MNRRALVSAVVGLACDGGRHASTDAASSVDAASVDAASVDAPMAIACPPGSRLFAEPTACEVRQVPPPESLATGDAPPGTIVSLDGLAEGTLPCLPAVVCIPVESTTMVFSDDPEATSTNGVLYADVVGPGRVRIYVYHVNGGTPGRKFTVALLEQDGLATTATIVKRALATGTDYVAIGKSVAAAWLASNLSTAVAVPPNTRVVLDPALDTVSAGHGELVHAIYDIVLDHPVKLSVVSLAAGADTVASTGGLPLLPNDGAHDRGTFPTADLWIAGVPRDGSTVRHLRLGADDALAGRDATTSQPARLRGNYGVAYRIVAPSTDRRFAISARGGAWAGATNELALGPLDTATDAIWLGTDDDFTVVTGGGSSLPIDVVVIDP